jgi:hypothetical protein
MGPCSRRSRMRRKRVLAYCVSDFDPLPLNVVPAKAGTQVCMRYDGSCRTWVPAFAGTTFTRSKPKRSSLDVYVNVTPRYHPV